MARYEAGRSAAAATGTEFDTSKLDLRIGAGFLRLYSEGTNWEAANTLVNPLTGKCLDVDGHGPGAPLMIYREVLLSITFALPLVSDQFLTWSGGNESTEMGPYGTSWSMARELGR